MRRGRGGTETARPLDVQRTAVALRYPGIDPRHWVSYGTVSTINADGSANFGDGSAVFVSPGGVSVDVLLMPANQHVTARYSGVQGGAAGTIFTPIHAGDEVLVVIPDGDLRLPPVIVCILSGEHSPLPLGTDRTPRWKNDRILVNANGVPIEVRVGDAVILVNPDGTVVVNGGTKGAARLDDTTKLTLSSADIVALATKLIATGAFVTTGSGPFPVPPPNLEFTGGQITSASGTVKVGG